MSELASFPSAAISRRGSPRRALLPVLGLSLGLFAASSAPAQDGDRGDDRPALGLPSTEGAERSRDRDGDGDRGRRSDNGFWVPYHVTPWYWYAPRTEARRAPPLADPEPRLGLRYYDGLDRGIRLPDDAEPTYTYPLGPFRGVVRSPQYPAWLHGEDGEKPKAPGDEIPAVDLLRRGEYKAAGRELARGFRRSEDPRYPLYLAEALFGLGEHQHAELLLRHALAEPAAFDALPQDVASHFPSREVYAQKVEELVASGKARFLAAYLLLFTEDATRGLDLLLERMESDPRDEASRRLYRRFLGQAFGAPLEDKDEAPEGDTAGEGAPEATKS